MTKLPQLQHRKDRDLAFISIKRKKIYLGKWGSPEVFIEYAKIISGGEIIKKSADEKPGTKQEPKKKTSVQDFIRQPSFYRFSKTRTVPSCNPGKLGNFSVVFVR